LEQPADERHLTDSEIAGFLDEDLSPDERRRVAEHLDVCAQCRDEIVQVARLVSADQANRAAPGSGRKGRKKSLVPAGLAGLLAAAAVATVFLVRPGGVPLEELTPELERSITEGVGQLVPHLPRDEAVLGRVDLRFVWADHGTESYRLTVTAEDGALLWSHSLADTVVVPPATVELPSGTRLFWYVDAVSAGVVARTGVRSFRIEP
jgi:hypothetical protein